jgi:hypothetical protein
LWICPLLNAAENGRDVEKSRPWEADATAWPQCVLITIAARRAFGHGAEAKRRRSGGGLRS